MKIFDNILCVADASLAQGPAIARAVSLADHNHANLTVVDVVPVIAPGGAMPAGSFDFQSAAVSMRRKELESLVAPYQQHRAVRVEVLLGQMFLEVVRVVLRDKHDLLIKPAENPDFMERLFGSNDMHLLRKCPCPVWLAEPVEKATCQRVLAAVDFDPDDLSNTTVQGLNQKILDLASSVALSECASLHLVHVWDAPGEMMVRSWAGNPDEAGMAYVEGERVRHQAALDRLRDQLRNQLGKEAYEQISPQFHLRRGAASTGIPELARLLRADLVVMGTVARTGIAGLLIGNTAESILDQLQCAVLAVKPPGFVCPVQEF